jgi:bifunctional enzyme CysN/CysC
MIQEKEYTLKIGTTRVPCRLEQVRSVQDVASLAHERGDKIDRYTVADCDLQLGRAIAFDPADQVLATGRFVVVDGYEICGGGIVREALQDRQTWVREKVLLRDYRWERSTISAEERAARFHQKPALIIVTGEKDSGKKPLARALEARLVEDGHLAYFLGIGNVLYGVDADIKGSGNNRAEHMRRLAEVAHILLDGGYILIVTAIELRDEDLDILRTTIELDAILTIWVGDAHASKVRFEMSLPTERAFSENIAAVRTLLENKGIVHAQRSENSGSLAL